MMTDFLEVLLFYSSSLFKFCSFNIGHSVLLFLFINLLDFFPNFFVIILRLFFHPYIFLFPLYCWFAIVKFCYCLCHLPLQYGLTFFSTLTSALLSLFYYLFRLCSSFPLMWYSRYEICWILDIKSVLMIIFHETDQK